MNDVRFEQDLRSVLLEDAPRDVPDDLRRRVAAVAETHPVASHASRPMWRHPAPLWIGAGAVLAVVLAVALLRFGPVSLPGVGGLRSPSPSVAGSSSPSIALPLPSPSSGELPSPSSTPAPSVSVSACLGADVKGSILNWQGAAGSRTAEVQVTNIAARACLIRGTPELQLVDARGRVLIDSAAAGPSGQPHVTSTDVAFELAPGGRLGTEVQASNYCGPSPSLPIDVAFTLPSGEEPFVAVPGPGVSSADAVPSCLGPVGGQVTMNGWRRP